MRLWMGDDCRMVVLMCWETRTTICSGFVPRKRFMQDKIWLVRHLVPVERFSRNKSVNRWHSVPVERFKRYWTVFYDVSFRENVLCGTKYVVVGSWCRFKRFSWDKMVFALRLVLFERIRGTNPFNMWHSVPFKRFEWYKMMFQLRFVPFERFSWDKTSNWCLVLSKRFR